MKKTISKKYKNHGLHIWCNDCKKVVTSNPCGHVTSQRFQSRIWNPITKKQDCIKTYSVESIEEAFQLHTTFKNDLKANNYAVPQPAKEKSKPFFLKESAQIYFDYLEDIGVESFERKNLTPAYIGDQVRYITRFLKTVQRLNGKVSSFPLNAIDKSIIGAFVEDVNALNLSDRSFNAHIGAVRYFIKYIMDEFKVDIENHFEKVKTRELTYDPEIIEEEDIIQLLDSITEVNGKATKGTSNHSVNYYRPWLRNCFLLALLTGERLDGVVLLQWKHIENNYIKIPNWKVNRIKNTEKYISYTPITQDLAELLISLNIKDNPEGYLIAPEFENRTTLKKFVSKAFTHYKRVSGIKGDVSFKNLRKTYITRMWELLGEKASSIKHTNDKTALKHYLDQKAIVSTVKNVRVFNIN